MEKQIYKDIPEATLQQFIRDCEKDGCSTEVSRQGNGLYTVVVTCNRAKSKAS